MLGEWQHGFQITSRGGTFEAYLEATQNLRHDPFVMFLSAGKEENKAEFLAEQERFLNGTFHVDPATRLMIYVPNLAGIITIMARAVLTAGMSINPDRRAPFEMKSNFCVVIVATNADDVHERKSVVGTRME